MRTILLLIFSAFFLMGCDNIETNTPAFQVELNNELFKAIDSRAEIRTDGSLIIQGITEFETLTLVLNNSSKGTYILGSSGINRAIFEDADGSAYTTIPFGEGRVTIEDNLGSLTGTFRFNAYRFGQDTLTAQKGFFYKVPILAGSTDDIPIVNVNMVRAEIDGFNFNASDIAFTNIDDILTITASQGDETIILTFSNDLNTGNYPIGVQNYTASYSVDGEEFVAVTGNLSIINHNFADKKVSGAFSFQTGEPENYSIAKGQFNINY